MKRGSVGSSYIINLRLFLYEDFYFLSISVGRSFVWELRLVQERKGERERRLWKDEGRPQVWRDHNWLEKVVAESTTDWPENQHSCFHAMFIFYQRLVIPNMLLTHSGYVMWFFSCNGEQLGCRDGRKQKWIYLEAVFTSVVLPWAIGQVGYWVEGIY